MEFYDFDVAVAVAGDQVDEQFDFDDNDVALAPYLAIPHPAEDLDGNDIYAY